MSAVVVILALIAFLPNLTKPRKGAAPEHAWRWSSSQEPDGRPRLVAPSTHDPSGSPSAKPEIHSPPGDRVPAASGIDPRNRLFPAGTQDPQPGDLSSSGRGPVSAVQEATRLPRTASGRPPETGALGEGPAPQKGQAADRTPPSDSARAVRSVPARQAGPSRNLPPGSVPEGTRKSAAYAARKPKTASATSPAPAISGSPAESLQKPPAPPRVGGQDVMVIKTEKTPEGRRVVFSDCQTVLYPEGSLGHEFEEQDEAHLRPDARGQTLMEGAIGWATAKLGSPDYNGWCLKFVRQAFNGVSSAHDAYSFFLKLGKPNLGAAPGNAPRGSLVFYDRHSSNQQNGHIGIALGGSKMLSALATVRVTTLNYDNRVAFLGWSYPPSDWLGRSGDSGQPPSSMDAACLRERTPQPGTSAGSAACRNNPVSPPEGYRWTALCSKRCRANAGCPRGIHNQEGWCFAFGGSRAEPGGWRCLRLDRAPKGKGQLQPI